MKISLDWISDFVDLSGISAEAIAERLTMATAETEGLLRINRTVDGIMVSQLVSIESIGDLKKVTVDCGTKSYQTVCSAPNLHIGLKAPFAPTGVKLATGEKIELTSKGGVTSEGVLCSAREIGLSDWHEELLECPGHLKNGTALSQYIPSSDVLIEIDNKSLTHRPDLWGHYGFARELAALFNRPLRPIQLVDLEAYKGLQEVPLKIEDKEGCPCYSCIGFEISPATPSPLIIQYRLHALGQRTFSFLVDLTNYVMFEIGQPTHAFNRAGISCIRVARMGKRDRFVPLDNQERQIAPDDLMIWSGETPVAIAGIMGGANSEVSKTTSHVLLESANFHRASIRRTSTRLNLRTEASLRFEKNLPPSYTKIGIARILHLINTSGEPYKITTRFSLAGELKDNFRILELSPGFLTKKSGINIPNDQIIKILKSIGFEACPCENGALRVGIPPHRSAKDISLPEDILEEVLRIYGYDHIEPRLPKALLNPVRINVDLRNEHKARRVLTIGYKFIEVHSYGWFDDLWLTKLGFNPIDALELKNPSASQNRLLRTTLLPNLFKLVDQNHLHRDAFLLFELGRVFYSDCNKGLKEAIQLAGISYQQGKGEEQAFIQFLEMKGALEGLSESIGGASLSFHLCENATQPWETPGRFVVIKRENCQLGTMGIIGNKLRELLSPNGQVVWFTLDFKAWCGPVYPNIRYQTLPKYPSSWQDFSMIFDTLKGYTQLMKILKEFHHPLLDRYEFLYSFDSKSLPLGKSSYTFRFWMQANERTLNIDDINSFRVELLQFLKTREIPLR